MDDEQQGDHLDAQAMRRRLRAWRHAHPHASFDEIEDAVQAEITRWQAHLVEQLLPAETPTDAAADRQEASPICGTCGRRMQRSGRRRREVQSRLGQPIVLERDYYVCPACGTGLFPPR